MCAPQAPAEPATGHKATSCCHQGRDAWRRLHSLRSLRQPAPEPEPGPRSYASTQSAAAWASRQLSCWSASSARRRHAGQERGELAPQEAHQEVRAGRLRHDAAVTARKPGMQARLHRRRPALQVPRGLARWVFGATRRARMPRKHACCSSSSRRSAAATAPSNCTTTRAKDASSVASCSSMGAIRVRQPWAPGQLVSWRCGVPTLGAASVTRREKNRCGTVFAPPANTSNPEAANTAR